MFFEHKRFAGKRGAALAAVLALTAIAVPAAATTTPTNIPNSMRESAATPESRELLVRADDALNAITYTYYSTANYWNDNTGVYKVDCSGYMNRMVEDTNPTSYDYVCAARDTSRPTAEDYYGTFRALPYDTTSHHWHRVKKVKDLRPGDVLVWKYTQTQSSGSTGHVMIVVSNPERDTRWSNVYRVRISDSARSGHSSDNRGSKGSGVGAGTILLRYDSTTGAPTAYAWSLAGYWHSDVKFAAARPD